MKSQPSDKTEIFRHLKGAFISGVIVFLVISLVLYTMGTTLRPKDLMTNFFITLLYNVSIYMANIFFAIYYSHKIDRLYLQNISDIQKFVLGVLLSLIITTLVVLILNMTLGAVLWDKSALEAIQYFGWPFWYIFWGITLIVALFVHGIEMIKEQRASEEREKELLNNYHNARFEAIKAQLDPHFLFNSLNVLSSLIDEAPHKAQRFIQGLSFIYRYVLEHRDLDFVSIAQEVAFARDYLQLLKMRFEQGLEYEIAVDEAILNKGKIIPLSLQILLENAIKHNIIQEERPIKISIKSDGTHIIVSNTYRPKNTLNSSTNMGLNNIQDRYKTLTKQEIKPYIEEQQFIVELPIQF